MLGSLKTLHPEYYLPYHLLWKDYYCRIYPVNISHKLRRFRSSKQQCHTPLLTIPSPKAL